MTDGNVSACRNSDRPVRSRTRQYIMCQTKNRQRRRGDNFYLVPRSLILSNAKDIARAKSRGGHSDFSENAVTVARQCRTCTDFPHYAACIRAGLHLSFEPVFLMWNECSTRRGVCQMKVQPDKRKYFCGDSALTPSPEITIPAPGESV